ncbi:hypothetical protein ACHAXT_004147 [Thalassiosira profunda]
MRSPTPLILLLVSGANAFSPAGRPLHLCAVGGGAARCTSRVTIGAHTRSANDALQIQPLRLPDAAISRASSITALQSTRPPSDTAAAVAALKADRQFTCKKRVAVLMAFLTGWADFLFIKQFNFFGTMMTGNSLKMGAALVDGRIRDALFFLSVIASYIVGVGVFRRAELSYKDKALNGLFAPLVAGSFLLSDYLTWANPACKFVPAMLLAGSWGIINSVGSQVTGTLIFVVTGAMTRFSNMIVDRISRTAGRKKIPKEGFLMSLSVIGGFILGSAWSALFSKTAPELATRSFGIMGGIYGLLFLWLDRTELGAWWSKKNGKLCEISPDEVDCN